MSFTTNSSRRECFTLYGDLLHFRGFGLHILGSSQKAIFLNMNAILDLH